MTAKTTTPAANTTTPAETPPHRDIPIRVTGVTDWSGLDAPAPIRPPRKVDGQQATPPASSGLVVKSK